MSPKTIGADLRPIMVTSGAGRVVQFFLTLLHKRRCRTFAIGAQIRRREVRGRNG